jgi:hypothetical protein
MAMEMVKMLPTPVKVKENLKHRHLTAVDPELVRSTHDPAVAIP